MTQTQQAAANDWQSTACILCSVNCGLEVQVEDGHFVKHAGRVRRLVHVSQVDETDSGAACLAMVCRYFGKAVPLARVRQLVWADHRGASLRGLCAGELEKRSVPPFRVTRRASRTSFSRSILNADIPFWMHRTRSKQLSWNPKWAASITEIIGL